MLEGIGTVILLISLTGLLLSDFHVDTAAQTNAELKHCLRYRATYRQAYKHILGIPSTPERLMEPALHALSVVWIHSIMRALTHPRRWYRIRPCDADSCMQLRESLALAERANENARALRVSEPHTPGSLTTRTQNAGLYRRSPSIISQQPSFWWLV